jgi:hypothetical protein
LIKEIHSTTSSNPFALEEPCQVFVVEEDGLWSYEDGSFYIISEFSRIILLHVLLSNDGI